MARSKAPLLSAALLAPALLAGASCSLEGLAVGGSGGAPSSSASGGAAGGGTTSSGAAASGGGAASSGSAGAGGGDSGYEAEDAALYGDMAIADDAAASGGKYTAVPQDTSCAGGLSATVFAVSVSAAGKYVILARVAADDGLHDSFFVSVDGGDEITFQVSANGEFVEMAVADASDKATPIKFTLEAGEHTVVFTCRESGTELDRIWLQAAPP